jgi:hypothetical protein
MDILPAKEISHSRGKLTNDPGYGTSSGGRIKVSRVEEGGGEPSSGSTLDESSLAHTDLKGKAETDLGIRKFGNKALAETPRDPLRLPGGKFPARA